MILICIWIQFSVSEGKKQENYPENGALHFLDMKWGQWYI